MDGSGTRLTGFRSSGLDFLVRDDGPLDGPVVIALHGFPQTSGSWAAVTPLLVAVGYRVLAPDQRGYSPGARPEGLRAYTADRLAGDVLALADAAGAPRFHLLGHDWGAAVGWTLAGRHPERVLTLTAVSVPHPAALRDAMKGVQALRSWYIALFQVPRLPELLLRVGHGALARRWLRGTGLRDVEPSVRLLADRRTATAVLGWYRAVRLPGQRGAGRIRVPVLHVWSDRDVALGRRATERTAHHVDGPYRLEVLAGASHWIPEERPAELAALVLDHLAQHSGV